jgi:hypothetical protein
VLAFSTNGTERARIDASGNVQLNTASNALHWFNGTTLGARLRIEQSTAPAEVSYVTQAYVRNSADLEGPIVGFAKTRGTSNGAATVVSANDGLGLLTFQGGDGTNYVEAARIAAQVDGTPGNNDMPGRLIFYTTADGASSVTERARIDASGNVGIGTTSPASLLNINNGDFWINVAATHRGMQFGFAGPLHGSYRAAVMGGAENYGATDSGVLTFHTQDGYAVSAIPPERMRITSAGNVGIGTTSVTTSRLRVEGPTSEATSIADFISNDTSASATYHRGIRVLAPSLPTGDKLLVSVGVADNTRNMGQLYFNYVGSGSTSNYLSLGLFAVDEVLNITGAGNVGIGTTSPAVKFHITQPNGISLPTLGTSTGCLFIAGDGNQYGLYVGNDGNTGNAWLQAMRNNTATAYNILLNPVGGNVGIGTVSPSYALSTSGTLDHRIFHYNSGVTTSDHAIIQAEVAGDNSGNAFFSASKTGTAWSFGRNTATGNFEIRSNFNLANDAFSRLQITTSGNVGIGTSAPSMKLHVAGGQTWNGVLYISPTNNNTLNSGYSNDGEDNDIWINYRGYNDGFTRFRDFRVGNGKGTEIAMFDGSSGNVGIGTTSPNKRLQVTHDTGDWVLGVKNYGDAAYGLQIDLSGSTGTTGTFVIGAYSQTGTGFFLTNAGNVGIGTTNPSTFKLQVAGAVGPNADIIYDLGSPSLRWANIYTADLQLSNEGAQNDIDGTWGKWTIQEGEHDLYLINRRTNKKYKFTLEEIE